jgi:hypothetical protein
MSGLSGTRAHRYLNIDLLRGHKKEHLRHLDQAT